MARRVVVVALLALGYGGALCLASAWDCAKPVKVTKNTPVNVKYETVHQPQKNMSTSLYVKPGSDFKAVCVRARNESVEPIEVCFPGESMGLNSTTWNLLKVKVEVVSNAFSYSIRFRLEVGSNTKTEEKAYSTSAITRLRVLANGSSEWLLEPPDACPNTTTENPASTPPSTSSFNSLTSVDQEHYTSTKAILILYKDGFASTEIPAEVSKPQSLMVIVVPVVAVVVVVTLAIVVAIWKRQRRPSTQQTVSRSIQSTGRRGAGTRDSMQVIENSLYEPLPGPMTPAARQEQPGTVQVMENSLYEPLPGRVTPAARQEQPGTVQVIENSLYEPLPGRVGP